VRFTCCTAVRILHTSDWHLGAAFHDRARAADEAHALAQLVGLARTHAVDAVLIAGDVFDTANPGAAEQRLWYRTLVDLVQGAGVATVAIIAGNHDSGLRIDGPKELLAALHVHVRGQLTRHESPSSALIPLRDRAGVQRAWCAAVPYLREGDVILAEDDGDRARRLARAVHQRWDAVRATVPAGLPWVAMTHAFAAGGRTGGMEHPVLAEVGNLGQADLARLAEGAAYAALGHLHRPQTVAGREHWRYCGSLLPSGFDEAGTGRSVVLAELPDDGSPASVSLLPLAEFRSYRRLFGSPEAILEAIATLPIPVAGQVTPWLQAELHLLTPQPGIHLRVAEAARARGWEVVSSLARRGGEAAGTAVALPVADLRALDPQAVFRLLHEQRFGSPPPPGLDTAYADLVAAIRAEPN